jgi:CRP/FNR family transcriptional regulator
LTKKERNKMGGDHNFQRLSTNSNSNHSAPLVSYNYDYLNLIRPNILCRKFKSKEVLYNAHDNFKNIYFVSAGVVKSFKTSSNGLESISGFQMSGEWVGLESIGNKNYSNYAQALVDSNVFVINYELMVDVLQTSNQALKDFNKTLSNEINRNINLANILKNSRRERKMIIFLMSIFNQNANHIGSDQGFDLNMSRGDISSYLSISREEISRILQKLEISGLIFVKNRHIALLNIPKLNAMCFDD